MDNFVNGFWLGVLLCLVEYFLIPRLVQKKSELPLYTINLILMWCGIIYYILPNLIGAVVCGVGSSFIADYVRDNG